MKIVPIIGQGHSGVNTTSLSGRFFLIIYQGWNRNSYIDLSRIDKSKYRLRKILGEKHRNAENVSVYSEMNTFFDSFSEVPVNFHYLSF